ncbi:ATP-dependent DNA helicase [Bacillus suaedaesalsae]|uniref:ATP-dependent DNA helicase n=1 Tax=Bacillus suaedaesalsae TaxID=2810349 RepID=A0ABS2DM64_9BACI|nr:ATP-dependent DNA helicase [Bacillus suaedaesalsae]MBM6619595.1 ATP-dependent DNA helicase [Bacillus suaedaesalsae]
MNKWNVSVRGIVEYVYRSGSIETSFQAPSLFMEGTKAHQAVQATYTDKDEKEVHLETDVMLKDCLLKIEGRCDGILHRDDMVTIDEIKSTSRSLEFFTEETTSPVHWAQAKMYAYMYAKQHELLAINVQLTYIRRNKKEKKHFLQSFQITELEQFFKMVIEKYTPYVQFHQHHQKEKNESSKKLSFPFQTYREGQRKLSGAVYKTIHEHQNLFALAPTGIGKTISTVFPSVKAIGEQHIDRIFYLTAKTITRTTAEDTFSLLKSHGLTFKTVTITAKDKACLKDETRCQKDYCEFANGYYDRINDAVLDILQHEDIITREVIESYSMKHKVCPFEFSLDLTNNADAIICDYNYIFDPRVSLKRVTDDNRKKSVLLVDEAHNLVDRGREMYSSTIEKSMFLELKRAFKGNHDALYQTVNQINQFFIQIRKSSSASEFTLSKLDTDFVKALESFASVAEEEIQSPWMQENRELLLDAYWNVQAFLKTATLYDERYVTYIEIQKNEVRMKILCLDPSLSLQKMGKGFRSKIFFSATLSPQSYYQKMIGAKSCDYTIDIPSPFRKEQTEVIIYPISTRYQHRDKTTVQIGTIIKKEIELSSGNILLFFPSYHYMNQIIENIELDGNQFTVLRQDTNMTEDKREEFISHFDVHHTKRVIAFAVLGGVFSEGIDLMGDKLNHVMICGVGLPQVGFERNIMKDYFQSIGRDGYLYSYVFLGINKVLQAGGRLIRSEEDYGRITLIDDRYLTPLYQSLLPHEWKHFIVANE